MYNLGFRNNNNNNFILFFVFAVTRICLRCQVFLITLYNGPPLCIVLIITVNDDNWMPFRLHGYSASSIVYFVSRTRDIPDAASTLLLVKTQKLLNVYYATDLSIRFTSLTYSLTHNPEHLTSQWRSMQFFWLLKRNNNFREKLPTLIHKQRLNIVTLY